MNKIILTFIIIIIVLVLVIGYLLFADQLGIAPEPKLTREIALQVIDIECIPEGGSEVEYASCTVDITKENDQWTVIIIFDGLRDDSVRAGKAEVPITYENGRWVKGRMISTLKCQPGRGHQDFSGELCI